LGHGPLGLRLGCCTQVTARRKPPLEPSDMEDRTSGKIGSHGFSRICRVWLAGRGFSGLTGCGFEPLSSAEAPPSPDFSPQPPIMEDRSSLGSRVHRSELLGSAPSPDLLVSLCLSLDISPPFSLSRLSISVSLSLAVTVFGQQNREETKKEERRKKKKNNKKREVYPVILERRDIISCNN
jgi:hypothetical protein